MTLVDLSSEDINRINSWLEEARIILNDGDFFKKMIFYWISFNCYYGARYEFKERRSTEITKIRHVFSQISDFNNTWSKLFIENNLEHIDRMDKNMTRNVYREQIELYKEELKNNNFRNAFRELLTLINIVRNRLFHGGKTYNNPEYGNKEVLLSCCKILDNLMTKLGFPVKS